MTVPGVTAGGEAPVDDDGPAVEEVTSSAYVIPTDSPEAGAVDCLQLDATRCGGFTEFLRGAALAAAHNLQVCAHCAPNLHAHVGTAVPGLWHVEYFHDHQRIERMLFDGALDPCGGILTPAPEPGLGIRLRKPDAARYREG